jgi:aromatic ring-cleaving dioxygenase
MTALPGFHEFASDGISHRVFQCERLRQEFGERFEAIAIPSPDPAQQIGPRAHAVLSLRYVPQPNHPTQQVFERVIAFLGQQLHA